MADYSDSFGSWLNIGLIHPSHANWNKLPRDCSRQTIFRCTFDCDWSKWNGGYPYKSYGLIKEEYISGNASVSSTWKRKIIPQPNSLIVSFPPIPFPNTQRYLLIKRYFWTSTNWGGHPFLDIPWQVLIDTLEV